MSSKIPVSFTCQRCHAPLRIHQSLENVDNEVVTDFARLSRQSSEGNAQPYTFADREGPSSLLSDGSSSRDTDAYASEDRLVSLDDDFAFLGIPQPRSESEAVSTKLRTQAFLFDMLSTATAIDHPLCADCCDTLISSLNSQLKQLDIEQADYT